MTTSSLVDRIAVPPQRAQVVDDCVHLIDAQVKAKSGLSGMAIKGAYATIKTIKKGFVTGVVEGLLDDWLRKLQPHHDRWEAGGKQGSFADHVIARSDDVAEDLLQVTDERAKTTTHTTAKKGYERMRGSAKKNVVDAIPELARLIEKHLNAAPVTASPPAAAPVTTTTTGASTTPAGGAAPAKS
jgi:hypothetical protein